MWVPVEAKEVNRSPGLDLWEGVGPLTWVLNSDPLKEEQAHVLSMAPSSICSLPIHYFSVSSLLINVLSSTFRTSLIILKFLIIFAKTPFPNEVIFRGAEC